ncbi:hypothetical protein NDU88_009365 [Pleurodeles waltl]|uniref:Uncharacterized protein n=1 Tax=Pleurodeles waltl TaxID=8319 RepID=A0AAV7QXB2_PLEWA|nr:hypothetical protein NDU88_009365 [Pleurodeles waltl]
MARGRWSSTRKAELPAATDLRTIILTPRLRCWPEQTCGMQRYPRSTEKWKLSSGGSTAPEPKRSGRTKWWPCRDAITNSEYKRKAERPLGPDTERGERDTENAIGACADPGTQDQVSSEGRQRGAPARRAGPERKPMRGPAEVRRSLWASVPIPPSER